MPHRFVWAFLALTLSTAAAEIAPDQIDSLALVTAWTSPRYPEAARKAKLEGTATVQFTVDEQGRVSDVEAVASTDPVFSDPAVEAVRQWQFKAAREAGHDVPCGLRVVVPFTLAALKKTPGFLPPVPPEAAPSTPARATFTPEPDYPEELADVKISGGVVLGFEVSRAGIPEKVRVLDCSHPAFVAPAMAALQRWRYEPARQGRAPLTSAQETRLTFDHFAIDRATLLQSAGIVVLNDAGEPDADGAAPEPLVVLEPDFPRALLLAGTAGEAEVDFTIERAGRPHDITVHQASAPEFGATLAAAVAHWEFNPTIDGGRSAVSHLRARRVFDPTAPATAASQRIARALAAGEIGSSKGLDEHLTPWWRCGAIYPAALRAEGISGEALLEIVIDREGRVRLPVVVSATRPEFGWAAAAAASWWVFAPPRRAGEPVDVRIRVPFAFKPDA